MIANIFLSFDPINFKILSLNWISSLLFLILFFYSYWLIPSRFFFIYLLILEFLILELKVLINKKYFINLLIYFCLFLFILINNFLRLFPYIFCSSRHLIFSLSLSLPLWLRLIFYGWINHINHIFSHLVPLGTPFILIPFIVLIETVRNLIRPLTLRVRLAANLIAGHLLITLLGNIETSLFFFILIIVIIFIQNLLLILEISVSFIQSYVFITLRLLYSSEVFCYDKL